MPHGPAKTGMLAFFAIVSLVMLVVTARKNRRAAQNQRL
jgi:hypothetical protein